MRATPLRSAKFALAPMLLAAGLLLPHSAPRAQPMQPGEAFVTRFSGTTDGPQGEAVIDVNGTVGSIIDVRSPGQPPQGHHWIDEPQRQPITAAQVGQVFGVALDGENPPNVYLAATAAFGLHRTADNAQWMPGMWGPGGPGAVYRIDARTGQPSLFARLSVGGRENTGAALGNIAYDRWNRQFFVSDLETGMIHRVRADGTPVGVWDHGATGRTSFFDAEGGKPAALPPIPFNPAARARIADCPTGSFATSPECWNIAASGRRVWGVGVSRDAKTGTVRLYYAVASSPAFGNEGWSALPEDQKRNSVWSVQLGPDGGFAGQVRREFLLPDFFETAEDIARAGYSQPASDITFPVCSNRGVMLVAERGGLRNLGLAEANPFADPHEARLLRYELDHEGVWRAVGRYDVGFRERQPEEGPPVMQSNCAGGAAFGYGYDTQKWTVARSQPDQFVWTTGDALCSSIGPCNAPGIGDTGPAGPTAQGGSPQQVSEREGAEQAGDVEVHGIQGIAEGAFQPVMVARVGATTGQSGQGSSLNEAYMIDTDINIDDGGNVDTERTLGNDATWIGDIAIFQICDVAPMGFVPAAVPPPPVGIGHDPQVSHSMYESHGRTSSHFRFGSHSPYVSHNRWQSHYRAWSHYRDGSHNRYWSHERRGSIHNRYMTHLRHGSPHDRRLTHQRYGTPHDRILTHRRFGSPHDRRLTHLRYGTPHDRAHTHKRYGSPHDRKLTHLRYGTPHDRPLTHQRTGTPHSRVLSHQRTGTPHDRALTHKRHGTPHNRLLTHKQQGSAPDVPKKQHTRAMTHAVTGSPQIPTPPLVPPQHTRAMTHLRVGSPKEPPKQHKLPASPGPIHTREATHQRTGSKKEPPKQHKLPASPGPQHNPIQSKAKDRPPQHKLPASPGKVHPRQLSQQTTPKGPPQHTRALSHARVGSPAQKKPPPQKAPPQKTVPRHTPAASHARVGSQPKQKQPPQHSPAASHQRTGSKKR
ncbi:MAG: hypothetical protein IT536_10345 [Hyphomicrobiales bacterium]|nr:hypothetical protein [Hyphomicrobiales bacterium]